MTDKEVLAELKRCYEYLYDIRENGCIDHCGGQIQYDLIKKLEDAKKSVEEVYSNFYKTLNREDLRVKNIERNGEKAYISSEASGDYEVGEENWNMNCADLDYYWYEDEDFLEDYEEDEDYEDYE